MNRYNSLSSNSSSGMLDLLRGSPASRSPKPAERRSRSTDSAKSPERPANTEAVIKLSVYPSAELRKDVPPAIEREDWPAPPATAVITKNLVRASLSHKYAEKDSDDEDENPIDPKIQKELDEISKIHDSAMVKCIREDLTEQIQHDKKKILDPRSASRTPSASKEPIIPPRFTSPINASPSRCLVERSRCMSDSVLKSSQNKKDRQVVHGTSTSHRYRIKPGYSFGYISKSLSTVPPGTPGAYVYDSFNNDSDEDEEDVDLREMERRMHVVDLVTRGADDDDRDSVFEPIPYSEICLSSENRRKGLSISNLEKYLSNDEFEEHLGTSREEFYKLPEFKQNDIKRKAKLF